MILGGNDGTHMGTCNDGVRIRSPAFPGKRMMLIAAGSVLQRQIRFSRRIAPIETRPFPLVQVLSISRGGGFGVESERQMDSFESFPAVADKSASDNCVHTSEERTGDWDEGDAIVPATGIAQMSKVLKVIPVMQCVSVACITGLPIEGKIAPVGFNGGSTPDPRPALRRTSSTAQRKRFVKHR